MLLRLARRRLEDCLFWSLIALTLYSILSHYQWNTPNKDAAPDHHTSDGFEAEAEASKNADFVDWLQGNGVTNDRHPVVTIADSKYVHSLHHLQRRLNKWGYGQDLVVLCLDDVCAEDEEFHGWAVHLDPSEQVMYQVASMKVSRGIVFFVYLEI